jgi:hypothetical protein
MKFYNSISVYSLFIIVFLISACGGNDDTINPNDKGTLTLHFDNIMGDADLKLGTGTYVNSSNESFTVSTLKYFVSNIKLKTTDNKIVEVPNNYFLVDESKEESQDVKLENIPAGNYNGVSFIIGVDSLKSTADVSQRTGVLDPESDMYWSFNSGYIFLKLEGTSSSAPDDHTFAYHIGGYGGSNQESKTFNNIKTINISTGADKAMVRKNIAPEIHMYVDVLKIFGTETKISIAENPSILFTEYSVNVANNFPGMIGYGHVHNDPVE